MAQELEGICSEIRKNLKSEEETGEAFENVDRLQQQIAESSAGRLANSLHFLIPTILDVTDNYELKVRGVRLIDQLVQGLDHQSFVKQGFDNLIIFTLKKQFYHQELELFKCLFTICQRALMKFNFQPVNTTKPATELDEMLDIVLNLIEIGTDENLRLICLEELPKLLAILNKAAYKNLNRLLDDFVYIVDPQFLTARPKQIRAFLVILNQLIALCSEKFDESRPLTVLIQLLYCLNELENRPKNDSHTEIDANTFSSVRSGTLDCLRSIQNLDPSRFKSYLDELKQNEKLKPIHLMIRNDLDLFEQ